MLFGEFQGGRGGRARCDLLFRKCEHFPERPPPGGRGCTGASGKPGSTRPGLDGRGDRHYRYAPSVGYLMAEATPWDDAPKGAVPEEGFILRAARGRMCAREEFSY